VTTFNGVNQNAVYGEGTTLHLSGEFAEHNLGTMVGPDGKVIVRAIATQFMFVPRCIAVPAKRLVTLRFATPDVIHGLLITGTNVNTMVVPGFVSQVYTTFTRTGDLLMPCHEYCGLGHQAMWAMVKVIDKAEFFKTSASKRRLTCVE